MRYLILALVSAGSFFAYKYFTGGHGKAAATAAVLLFFAAFAFLPWCITSFRKGDASEKVGIGTGEAEEESSREDNPVIDLTEEVVGEVLPWDDLLDEEAAEAATGAAAEVTSGAIETAAEIAEAAGGAAEAAEGAADAADAASTGLDIMNIID